MQKDEEIIVFGSNGLVGSAITRLLKEQNYNVRPITRKEVDLRDESKVEKFFNINKPSYIFLCAAKVGGILANNDYPAEFIKENLQIQTNVIHQSYMTGVKKLCFLGSSCIYPSNFDVPIKESDFLSGKLESTNKAYAIAKIAGIEMAQSYNKQYGYNIICLMPTNLFGIGDNFDLRNSHVLPALLRKFHEAKIENRKYIKCWGTGTPKREFLYVDDMANASIFLMNNYNSSELINVGCGEDISIKELAELIKEITEFQGEILWDISKPDGTKRKLLNIDKITVLGWKPKYSLKEGISKTYEWYKESLKTTL